MEKEAQERINNLNQLGDTISKIIPIPYTNTSLADNLKSYGVKVVYFNNQPYNAFLFWDRKVKAPVIALNAFLDDDQTIFSMAHELGHLLINYYWSPLDGKCQARTKPTEYCGGIYRPSQIKNESTMDGFAESYLMPDHLIKSLINNDRKNGAPEFAIINQMSHKFRVPRTKAKQRFADYNTLLSIESNSNEPK